MNFLTLACRDVERMADFFRALGWPEAPGSEPVHRVFQLNNGVVLALYGAFGNALFDPVAGDRSMSRHGLVSQTPFSRTCWGEGKKTPD